jgi:hypothetical protein
VPTAFAQHRTVIRSSFNLKPPARVLLGKQRQNKYISSALYICSGNKLRSCTILVHVSMHYSAASWSISFCQIYPTSLTRVESWNRLVKHWKNYSPP